MNRVVIILGDGIIQQVLSDESLDLTIVDMDAEAFDEEDLVDVDGSQARVYEETVDINSQTIDQILEVR